MELSGNKTTIRLVRPKLEGVGTGHNQCWEEEHHNWKGSEASTKAKHNRIRRRRGKASTHKCIRCLEYGIDRTARYWARIHTESGDDPWSDYVSLCAQCHEDYDEIEKLPKRFAAIERQREIGILPQLGYCRRGHELNEETAYVYPRGKNATPKLVCKKCMTIARKKRRERRRDA